MRSSSGSGFGTAKRLPPKAPPLLERRLGGTMPSFVGSNVLDPFGDFGGQLPICVTEDQVAPGSPTTARSSAASSAPIRRGMKVWKARVSGPADETGAHRGRALAG